MKIKITAELPVAEGVCPEVGSIHEAVLEKTPHDMKPIYFIRMGEHNAQIGVFPNECEVIEE